MNPREMDREYTEMEELIDVFHRTQWETMSDIDWNDPRTVARA